METQKRISVSASLATITPTDAARMLDGEQRNRPIRDGHVAKLARSMKEGMWELNGSAIVINKSGNINDGQHRLWACVQSGVAFRTLFVEGVDDKEAVFDSLGEQLSRTGADIFSYRGVKSAHMVASAVNILWYHDHNCLELWQNSQRLVASKHELWELYKAHNGHGEIDAAATFTSGFPKLLPPSLTCFSYYVFGAINRSCRDKFFAGLKTGLDLKDDMAVYHLRKRLEAIVLSRNKLLPRDRLALLIRAWNLTLQNRPTKLLRWNPGQEEFPKIEKTADSLWPSSK